MKIFYIFFFFTILTIKTQANSPVYNFTFHNYSNGQTPQEEVNPSQPQTVVPLVPTPQVMATELPAIVKEENFNPWRLFYGQQQQLFSLSRSSFYVSKEQDYYKKNKFKQTHNIIGLNIPITKRISLKPMYLFGKHDLVGQTPDGGEMKTIGTGGSQGIGSDLEANLFNSKIDIRLGVAYRYFRNNLGALKNLSPDDKANVVQDLQTIAAYFSPTFTYQFLNLSIHGGAGTIINEKISSNYSTDGTKAILKKSFIQYGATLAINF